MAAVKDFMEVNFALANNEEKVKETEKIYEKQCQGLIQTDSDQLDLFKILTVGRLNNIPLLLWLCDAFTRDRIACCLQKDKILDIKKWIEISPTIKKLKNSCAQNKNYAGFEETIKSAMDLYFKRYNTKISFASMGKINGSVQQFAKPVLKMIDFINDLCEIKIKSDDKKEDHIEQEQKHNVLPPFQFELMIIPPPAIILNDDEDNSDDDDDDDQKEENDEKNQKIASKKCEKHQKEIIGDIEKRLAQCAYVVDTSFEYRGILRKLKQKMQSDKSGDNFSSIHQKRYCVAVDFRKQERKTYMFVPPISNQFDTDVVDEHLIQLSYDCVLPCPNITAHNGESQVFILSFQVFAADKIKCYWYQGNKAARFFPQDIISLWPLYFAQQSNDATEMQSIEKEIKKQKLKDDRFKSFYQPLDLNNKNIDDI